MTVVAWIIVSASIIALLAILWMLRGPSSAAVNLDQLRSQLRPMDVDAFRAIAFRHQISEGFIASACWLLRSMFGVQRVMPEF